MASQLLGIKTRFTNDLGSPLVGGQVYTYFAGTSTNQDSYSDAALAVPNTNPVILDDTGSANIFLKGAYRIRVFDKSGRFIEEQDNVTQAASQGDATEISDKIASVESDLSTTNTELNKVKFDTGITAAANYGGDDRALYDKLSDRVSFLDVGAIGNGTDDDTAAIVAAISNTDIKEIDGLNKQYKITSAQLFTRGNLKIKNASFLVSSLTTGQFAMTFKGSQAASVSLTADANVSDITVASASGFAVNDFIYIESNKEWSSTPFPVVKCGEIAQIKSIEGTKINLKGELGSYYKLTDSAKVSKLNLLDTPVFDNVAFTNLDDEAKAEGGLKLELCKSAYVNVKTRNFQYAHVSVVRSAYTTVVKPDLSGCKTLVGTNYGIVVTDGCYVLIVKDGKGDDFRHFVSVGNTVAGGINRFITVQNCDVTNMHDAFFDSHVGCLEFVVNNCTGSTSTLAVSNQDGVAAQNANCKVTNCNFSGVGRSGISYTPQVNTGVCRKPLVLTSSNNEYYSVSNNATTKAILAQTASETGREAISLASSDNDKCDGFGFHFFANAIKSVINKISITNPNVLVPTITRGVEIRASESDVGLVVINGGILSTASAYDVVYLAGYVGGGTIQNWSIGGGINLVGNGATKAVRAKYTTNGFDGGIQAINCDTWFDLGSTNAKFSGKTDLVYSTSWVGGAIASGASAAFTVTAAAASFGDFTKATLSVAAQGCDVRSRIDTEGQVRVEIYNGTGSSKTFGALKAKVAINKNI